MPEETVLCTRRGLPLKRLCPHRDAQKLPLENASRAKSPALPAREAVRLISPTPRTRLAVAFIPARRQQITAPR
jgi:hypothetical protein